MTNVRVDRELCIGSGNCLHFMPGVFALDDDGLAVITDPDSAELDQLQMVARQCPTGAVSVGEVPSS